MIKLLDLIQEQDQSRPKAVVMAGGAGAGKSFLMKQLGLISLPMFNPDKYVEDPDHPYHNKLGPASSQVAKDVAAAAESKTSLVWDTTASGVQFRKGLDNLLDKGYKVYMVMVYTHPMVSYISNFARSERSIPSSAVFSTWRNAYQKIAEYNKLTNGNFSLFANDHGGKFTKEIEGFNTAAKNGINGVKDYLKAYNERTGAGKSTFFQPVDMSQAEEQEFKKAISGFVI